MSNPRKIIFRQGQSPGDILTFTRALYDFCRAYPDYEIDIRTPCPELFINNPYTTDLSDNDPDVEIYNITYDMIHQSGRMGIHFSDAFRIDIEQKVNEPHLFDISIKNQNGDQLVKNLVKSFQSQWSGLSDNADIQEDTLRGLEDRTTGKLAWIIKDEGREYTAKWNCENPDILHINYFNKIERWGTVEIPMTGLNPEIYFTDEEKSWFNQIHCDYYWDGPFWLINAGRKSDNELKQYRRWQEVVNILNDYWQGKVRIVQIGSASGGGMDHIHPPLKGAFNLIAKTDIRQLLRLAYWSEGVIGPISFQFVIGAALDKPNVICAGGKEGTRWHIYNPVRWVNQNGCLPCSMSDGCWLGGRKGDCKNLVTPDDMDEQVPKCFEITTPQMLADAVIQYYSGGRLSIPDEEKWHVPDGEELDDVKAKFDGCYNEGRPIE